MQSVLQELDVTTSSIFASACSPSKLHAQLSSLQGPTILGLAPTAKGTLHVQKHRGLSSAQHDGARSQAFCHHSLCVPSEQQCSKAAPVKGRNGSE